MDFTLIGSIMVGLFALWGVKVQIKASEKNISKQVKEELEKEKKLLDAKIMKEREDKFWNVKFDLFVEINNAYSDFANVVLDSDAGDLKVFRRKLDSILGKCIAIFDSDDLTRNFMEIRTILALPNNEKSLSRSSGTEIGKYLLDSIKEIKKELVFR